MSSFGEPWKLDKDNDIVNAMRLVVASSPFVVGDEQQAELRRAAACVNGCVGLDPTLFHPLIGVMKRMLAAFEAIGKHPNDVKDFTACCCEASDLLAKVEL